MTMNTSIPGICLSALLVYLTCVQQRAATAQEADTSHAPVLLKEIRADKCGWRMSLEKTRAYGANEAKDITSSLRACIRRYAERRDVDEDVTKNLEDIVIWVRLLSQCGNQESWPALQEVIENTPSQPSPPDAYWEAKREAVVALKETGFPVQQLLSFLDSKEDNVVAGAIEALAFVDDASVQERLAVLLASKYSGRSGQALASLSLCRIYNEDLVALPDEPARWRFVAKHLDHLYESPPACNRPYPVRSTVAVFLREKINRFATADRKGFIATLRAYSKEVEALGEGPSVPVCLLLQELKEPPTTQEKDVLRKLDVLEEKQ